MHFKTLKIALAGLVLSTGAASAITIDFKTFGSDSNVGTSNTYTTGLVSVTASATSDQQGAQVVERTSPSFYRGLGVVDGLDTQGSIDPGQVLSFAIPSGYQVDSVEVARRGSSDQIALFFMDGISVGSELLETMNDNSNDGRETVSINAVGSIFSVTSAETNTGGIWVNSLELSEVGSVPLPAGIVLLGGALGVGGFASRRKSKSA